MEEIVGLCRSTDVDLPKDILYGMPTIGDAPITGNWEPDEKELQAEKKNVMEFYTAAIKLREAAPKGFPVEALQKVVEDIEKDVELGRYREISLKELKCQPAYAFPKVEPKKVRTIVDERCKNLYSRLPEKVKLAGVRTIVEIIHAYNAPLGKERLGAEGGRMPATQSKKELTRQVAAALHSSRVPPEGETKAERKAERKTRWKTAKKTAAAAWSEFKALWRQDAGSRAEEVSGGRTPEMASRDWTKAYYLIGVQLPDMNPVAAYDPAKGVYRLWVAHVLNMGNRHSVTSWCRVAELVMRAMARVAKTVVPIYIDDATIFGLSTKEALEAYDALSEALGLELSEKEESNEDSSVHQKVQTLGVDFHWLNEEEFPGGPTRRVIRAQVPERQYLKMEETIDELLEQCDNKAIEQKKLQGLLGLANYITITQAVRAGAELLRGLYTWATGDFQRVRNRNERRSLKKLLAALKDLARDRRPMILRPGRRLRKRLALLTDASTDGGDQGKARIAALLIDEDGQVHATAETVEEELRIEVLEAMAVQLGSQAYADKLTEADVVVGVDNLTAAYAFIKCSSRSAKTQDVVVATIKKWYASGTKAYYVYVPSEENLADHFTRNEKQGLAEEVLQPRWKSTPDKQSERVAGDCAPSSSPPSRHENVSVGVSDQGSLKRGCRDASSSRRVRARTVSAMGVGF
jgi:hypothetical protein